MDPVEIFKDRFNDFKEDFRILCQEVQKISNDINSLKGQMKFIYLIIGGIITGLLSLFFSIIKN